MRRNATGRAPNSGSGTGTTIASSTPGKRRISRSISSGWMFSPPEMNIVSRRPVTTRRPSASRCPRSPEWNQPAASRAERTPRPLDIAAEEGAAAHEDFAVRGDGEFAKGERPAGGAQRLRRVAGSGRGRLRRHLRRAVARDEAHPGPHRLLDQRCGGRARRRAGRP